MKSLKTFLHNTAYKLNHHSKITLPHRKWQPNVAKWQQILQLAKHYYYKGLALPNVLLFGRTLRGAARSRVLAGKMAQHTEEL